MGSAETKVNIPLPNAKRPVRCRQALKNKTSNLCSVKKKGGVSEGTHREGVGI